MNFKETLAEKTVHAEDVLTKYLPEEKGYQKKVIESMNYSVLAGGKRLRPILMTSFAFGLGVLPLAIAHAAGSGAQNAIGVGVLGGMITGTILCVALVPAFFVFVTRIAHRISGGPNAPVKTVYL